MSSAIDGELLVGSNIGQMLRSEQSLSYCAIQNNDIPIYHVQIALVCWTLKNENYSEARQALPLPRI
jgi:hypothetical protein